MKYYNLSDVRKLIEEKIPQFEVDGMCFDGGGFNVHLKPKITLAEYCRNNSPKSLIFKNNSILYKIERFYINVDGHIKFVYVLKKADNIVNVISSYEFKHPENFANEYLEMHVEEILEEVK